MLLWHRDQFVLTSIDQHPTKQKKRTPHNHHQTRRINMSGASSAPCKSYTDGWWNCLKDGSDAGRSNTASKTCKPLAMKLDQCREEWRRKNPPAVVAVVVAATIPIEQFDGTVSERMEKKESACTCCSSGRSSNNSNRTIWWNTDPPERKMSSIKLGSKPVLNGVRGINQNVKRKLPPYRYVWNPPKIRSWHRPKVIKYGRIIKSNNTVKKRRDNK